MNCFVVYLYPSIIMVFLDFGLVFYIILLGFPVQMHAIAGIVPGRYQMQIKFANLILKYLEVTVEKTLIILRVIELFDVSLVIC